MRTWTEFHIALVYYGGLLISLLSVLAVLLYLRPIAPVMEKLTKAKDWFWSRSFRVSLLMAGMVGAMSVSFTDCDGHYDYLLKSRYATAMQGAEQVAEAWFYIAGICGLWLVGLVFVKARSK